MPPASAFAAARNRNHAAVQGMGEGMRSGTIQLAGSATKWIAAIWRHDPERPAMGDGGPVLKERLVFTIRKSALRDPTVLFGGEEATGATIIYKELGRAFIVEASGQETTDHIAWKFEARRAPGADPS